MVFNIVSSVILAMGVMGLAVILQSSSKSAERMVKQEAPLSDEQHSNDREER